MAAVPNPATREGAAGAVDVARLRRDLAGRVRGEVRFDAGSRALYASDGSIYRQVPIGVVLPRDEADVLQAVASAREHGAPVLMRGGGTSLAGQTVNEALVLDCSKYMNRVLRLDARRREAWVQPGCVLDDLRDAAEKHGLTFAPDPATHNHCTLGGMLGNNSCGTHSVMGGKTLDNTDELDILTYDGLRLRVGPTSEKELEAIIAAGDRRAELYAGLRQIRDRYGALARARYPKIPRRVSGYNIDQLLPDAGFHVARALVGSESTCAIILAAKLRLLPSPKFRPLLALGYADAGAAGDAVPGILEYGPIALEGFDDVLLTYYRDRGEMAEEMALLPAGGGWLLVEFGGDSEAEAEAPTRRLMADLARRPHPPTLRLSTDRAASERLWKLREKAVGVTSRAPGGKVAWPGWEDSAVAPEKLGGYIRDLRALLHKFRYQASIFGHFGQACLHLRIDFNLRTAEGVRTYRRFMEEAADLVVGYGGSLSGEHGDGQARAELLPKMVGSDLVRGLEEFKAVWDPEWRLNPGKMVAAYRLDENLRLGSAYRPTLPPSPRATRGQEAARSATIFQFPDDKGDFAAAALRCSGLGVCRRHDHGVMCPSYMVTREERHSTRGRARLLWEMLQGEVITGGWRDPEVREALDLCLACKGCRSDCPVNVDMATYKAEFLAHFYAGRLRPASAYALGCSQEWLPWAARAPRVVNALTQTPGLSALGKLLAGVSQRRRLPPLAAPTFREWFAARSRRDGRAPEAAAGAGASRRGRDAGRVILWPDTFTNYFQPSVARAAVSVLEAAGCEVALPRGVVCCGRPLFDYGMLDRAKHHLRAALATLGEEIDRGVPVIALEPSCAAVLRDELVNLFPHDERARRLRRQTFVLAEFLTSRLPDYRPPRLRGRALIQAHCHHRALLNWNLEEKLLQATGLECEFLDSGCCGMAGSFGYERAHYAVSRAVGERRLLPAVRQADRRALLLADGFSCREQIAQCTPRRALHLAQALELGLRQAAAEEAAASDGPQRKGKSRDRAPTPPERAFIESVPSGAALAAALAAGAGAAWWLARRAR